MMKNITWKIEKKGKEKEGMEVIRANRNRTHLMEQNLIRGKTLFQNVRRG